MSRSLVAVGAPLRTLVALIAVVAFACRPFAADEGNPSVAKRDAGRGAKDAANAEDVTLVPIEPEPEGVEDAGPLSPCVGHCSVCNADEESVIIRPSAGDDITHDPYTLFPSNRSYDSVVDDSDPKGDGDGSYVESIDTGPMQARIRYVMNKQPTIPNGRVIRRVAAATRVRRVVGPGPLDSGTAVGLFLKGQSANGINTRITDVGSSYVVMNIVRDVHPVRGDAWKASDIDITHVNVFFLSKAADNQIRVTQVWLEVCLAPP